MRNSSVLIWFWLLLIGNRSFLHWSALTPMRNSSFLIRVWFLQIRQSRLSGGDWKRRSDVFDCLRRLFTAKKVARSATFYK